MFKIPLLRGLLINAGPFYTGPNSAILQKLTLLRTGEIKADKVVRDSSALSDTLNSFFTLPDKELFKTISENITLMCEIISSNVLQVNSKKTKENQVT